jgi:PAS domain S-box-containing protein
MHPSSDPTKGRFNNFASDKDKRETERLAALDYLDAVRPEVDQVLQQLVDDVRSIFGTELCMVNLILSDVQYFRAWSGELPEDLAEAKQDSRERSMCQYVVETEGPLVVEDFLATEEFKDQYFCVNYGIRFYAGTPLITSDRHAIGTLCLLSTQPKEISEEQMTLLVAFARAVVGRLELLGALRREQDAKEKEAQHSWELRRTLDSSQDMIATIDADGVFRAVNPASKAILGYEVEELVGKNYMDLVHPEDRDRSAELTVAARDGAIEPRFENRCLRKDGSAAWIEWSATSLREERVTYCTARDVTERKRAEEALKESEERYRRLVELSPNAVIVHSGGDILYINGAGTNLLGASSSEEIVGKSILSFVHPDYWEVARERIRHIREGRRVELLEEKFVRLDGSVVDVEVMAAPIAYLGQPAAQAVVRDVTERKRAETALRENEERFRLLAEKTSDLICLHEPDGRYMYISPSCERLLGYKPEELLGTDPYALFHPEDAQHIRSEAHTKVLQGELAVSITYRIRKKSGEYTWFETITEPILNEEGNVVRLQTSSRDVSERKKAEEALAEATRAKIDFLADVSHELRTPLTVIRGNAEVGLQLERDCVHREILEEIVAESGSMSRMVEDLLFLVRSDSLEAPFEQEPVSVKQFLTDLVSRAEVLVRKHGGLLQASLSGEGLLRVDMTRIEQAVLALVDNAAKYGPEGGTITLSSRASSAPPSGEGWNGRSGERPKELCIEVADDGPGIPQEDLPRVFERFYRVDKDRSKKTGGTGLGLSIAKSVVEAHGGRIEPRSRPGEGTRMSIYLPLVPLPFAADQLAPRNAP